MAKKKVTTKKLQHKHLSPENTHKKLNAIMTLQRQNDIITMLLEGKDPNKEIKPYIIKKYKLTPGTANFYLHGARKIIKDRKNFEVNNLVSLHISRYELIYGKLYDIKAHSVAMSALKHKERLLGFHRQGFYMRVNQGEIQQIQNQYISNDYDLSKLSSEKENRLNALLTKAKR
jgi:hypothetical protein